MATPSAKELRAIKPSKRCRGICDSLRDDRRAAKVVFAIEQWRAIQAVAGDKLSMSAAVRLLVERGLGAA
jgi:hypothetical protein